MFLKTPALQILPTTELLSNFHHLSSVSEVYHRVDERISAIPCRVGDTLTDVAHPLPRLSPTGILRCESSLLRLQFPGCHPCQVASLDVHHHVRVDGSVDEPLADTASQGQVMRLEHRLQTSSGVIIDEVLQRSGQHGKVMQTEALTGEALSVLAAGSKPFTCQA